MFCNVPKRGDLAPTSTVGNLQYQYTVTALHFSFLQAVGKLLASVALLTNPQTSANAVGIHSLSPAVVEFEQLRGDAVQSSDSTSNETNTFAATNSSKLSLDLSGADR